MDRTSLIIKARNHWKEWLPKKTEELRKAGQLEAALQTAAANAQNEIQSLMQQGYQEHEAEEVALPQYILLKPEPQKEDWESRELAEKEAAYQRMMRGTQT